MSNPTSNIQAPATAASAPLPSGPLTQFTGFPRLPTELRHQIWFCGARQPRIIATQLSADNNTFINHLHPLLHVSHEAREETKQCLHSLESTPSLLELPIPGQPLEVNNNVDLSNDIFMLQLESQNRREPDARQQQARKEAETV